MKSSASTQFFRGTLAALDVAYLHPRFCRYVDFQDSTGDVVHRYLTEGSSEKLVMRDLNSEFERSLRPPEAKQP